VRHHGNKRCAVAVVERKESRRLEPAIRSGPKIFADHSWMRARKSRHQNSQDEQRMDEAYPCAERPGCELPAFESKGIHECKYPSVAEVNGDPTAMARSRLGVIIVPTRNGIPIRVRPSPWLADTTIVRMTVDTKPHSMMLGRFTKSRLLLLAISCARDPSGTKLH
jgi:hypothetical protein